LFAFAILNLAANPKVIVSLENKMLKYLGKISFGLYLYHWVIIIFVINLLRNYVEPMVDNAVIFNLLLYISSISLTVLVSSISYFFIEYMFLKLKHRFSKITSD